MPILIDQRGKKPLINGRKAIAFWSKPIMLIPNRGSKTENREDRRTQVSIPLHKTENCVNSEVTEDMFINMMQKRPVF